MTDKRDPLFLILLSSAVGPLKEIMRTLSRIFGLAPLVLAYGVAEVVGAAVHATTRALSTPAKTTGSFKSQIQADVGLRFIRNSGVCETTPGVEQLSGYIDFGTNMSMVRLYKQSMGMFHLTQNSNSGFGSSNLATSLRLPRSPCG